MNDQLPKLLFVTIVRYAEGRSFCFPISILRAAKMKTYSGALEYVFRQMNHVDGPEWISSHHFAQNYDRARSMSVGDTVEIKTANESRHFRVDSEGWSEVIN